MTNNNKKTEKNIEDTEEINELSDVSFATDHIGSHSINISWSDSDYTNSNYTVAAYATGNTSQYQAADTHVVNVSNNNTAELTGLLGKTEYKIVLYKQGKIVSETTVTTKADFLIIIGDSVYNSTGDEMFSRLKNSINTYVEDLKNEKIGADILVVFGTNGTIDGSDGIYNCQKPEDLKSIIRERYDEGKGAEGFVLIGGKPDIPVPFTEKAVWGFNNSPADLYYADMDGQYVDADNNGIFEIGGTGGGYDPEMYFGRISAKEMSADLRDEAINIGTYLNRVHNYRVNGNGLDSDMQNRAFIFNNAYKDSRDSVSEFSKVSQDVNAMYADSVSNANNLYEQLNYGYKFISIEIHSDSKSHVLNNSEDGCNVTIEDLWLNTIPVFNFLNLMCCSALKYDGNYPQRFNYNLGEYYLFQSFYGLNVAGASNTQYEGSGVDKCPEFYNNLVDGVQ